MADEIDPKKLGMEVPTDREMLLLLRENDEPGRWRERVRKSLADAAEEARAAHLRDPDKFNPPDVRLIEAVEHLVESLYLTWTALLESACEGGAESIAALVHGLSNQLGNMVGSQWINMGSAMGLRQDSMFVHHGGLMIGMAHSLLHLPEPDQPNIPGSFIATQKGGHCIHQVMTLERALAAYVQAGYQTATSDCADADPLTGFLKSMMGEGFKTAEDRAKHAGKPARKNLN